LSKFYTGKKYGSKGYRQRNAAHMGSISLWISFAASIFFAHKKTHNATLFYRGTCIKGRRHLVTAATSVVMRIPIVVRHNKTR
jgi:hypothetical protein